MSYRRTTGQPTVRVTPPEASAREVTDLAGSPVSRLAAHAMTSQGLATLAVSETPSRSRSAAVTIAAGLASAWIRMYEAIT